MAHWIGMCIFFQSLQPPLTPGAVTALYNYIEGDVFRCSRRMAAEDLAIALSADAVALVPGLSGVAKSTLQIALRDMKQRALEPVPALLPHSVSQD